MSRAFLTAPETIEKMKEGGCVLVEWHTIPEGFTKFRLVYSNVMFSIDGFWQKELEGLIEENMVTSYFTIWGLSANA